MKDLSKETYTFEEALEAVMEGESWEQFIESRSVCTCRRVLEDMYNIAGQSGFTEGRHSMEKEWKKYSDRQKQTLDILKDISKELKKGESNENL